MSKLIITIEVVDGIEKIILTDNIGNEKHLNGIMIIGGSLLYSEHYMVGMGKPSEIALSFGEGLAQAIKYEITMGDGFYTAFYNCLLAEMIRRTGNKPNKQEVDGDEVLSRWEEEDKTEACIHGGKCVCKKGPVYN